MSFFSFYKTHVFFYFILFEKVITNSTFKIWQHPFIKFFNFFIFCYNMAQRALINIGNIPIGCLYNSISELEAQKISLVSQAATKNENLADICLSTSLWKNLYSYHFPNFEFKTSQKNNDVDWLNRYAKRYAISSNIKANKPKVKSFMNNDISKIRTLTNAFAFNTPKDISLVVYDYLDNECKYEETSKFEIGNNDFIFLNNHTMVSVGDTVALFDLNQSSEILRSNNVDYRFLRPNNNINLDSHIQSINESSFAILWNKNGTIYDTRDNMFSRRCHFQCDDNLIATASVRSILYTATPSGITAYDTRGSRGMVLWKKYYRNDKSTFCDFNMNTETALLGNRIINLQTGLSQAFYDPAYTDNSTRRGANTRRHMQDVDMPINGAIVNDKYAVFGFEKRSVVLFDYKSPSPTNVNDDDSRALQTGKVVSTFEFADGGIKSISAAYINNVIAVAADFSIKILKISKRANDQQTSDQLTDIRSVVTGSVGARKRGDIGPIKQVVFDGERLITNMGTFVRVYDFYTAKSKK